MQRLFIVLFLLGLFFRLDTAHAAQIFLECDDLYKSTSSTTVKKMLSGWYNSTTQDYVDFGDTTSAAKIKFLNAAKKTGERVTLVGTRANGDIIRYPGFVSRVTGDGVVGAFAASSRRLRGWLSEGARIPIRNIQLVIIGENKENQFNSSSQIRAYGKENTRTHVIALGDQNIPEINGSAAIPKLETPTIQNFAGINPNYTRFCYTGTTKKALKIIDALVTESHNQGLGHALLATVSGYNTRAQNSVIVVDVVVRDINDKPVMRKLTFPPCN